MPALARKMILKRFPALIYIHQRWRCPSQTYLVCCVIQARMPNYNYKYKISSNNFHTKMDDFWGRWVRPNTKTLQMLPNHFIPIIPGLFLNSIYPGGGKFAPPYKMPNNGREVPKLSWNLISYRDWCQTKGFTTFRHLKPPQLMVWKMTFSGGLWGS